MQNQTTPTGEQAMPVEKPQGAKYCLVIAGKAIWDVELLRRIGQFSSKKAYHHRFMIDGLRAQGAHYANQDFDVLSAALAYLRKAEQFS